MGLLPLVNDTFRAYNESGPRGAGNALGGLTDRTTIKEW